MPDIRYLAIEGAIGIGKTTLARLMQAEFDAQLLLEVFEENPFLSDFYSDRTRYAFQTQIFFLLSRYHQQHEVLSRLLRSGTVISDYTFAKDWLFAHLNLHGDELATYERLHQALAENVVRPDLIVYLRADTPALMERIAVRDRSYERGMSVDYIESLCRAYDEFMASYVEAPILRIDTNHLDIVRNPHDLAEVMQRVRSALGHGTHQQALPHLAISVAEAAEEPSSAARRRLTDLQRWRRLLDADAGLRGNPYYNAMRLQERVGKLAGHLARVWSQEESDQGRYGNREEALEAAARRSQEQLQGSLADCLTCILRLANRLGIDLEGAYLRRQGAPGDQEEGDGLEERS